MSSPLPAVEVLSMRLKGPVVKAHLPLRNLHPRNYFCTLPVR